MDTWLPMLAIGLFVAIALTLLARYQGQRYQLYLSQHTEETRKITAGQTAALAELRAQGDLRRQQNALLERITLALEKRP